MHKEKCNSILGDTMGYRIGNAIKIWAGIVALSLFGVVWAQAQEPAQTTQEQQAQQPTDFDRPATDSAGYPSQDRSPVPVASSAQMQKADGKRRPDLPVEAYFFNGDVTHLKDCGDHWPPDSLS